MRVSVLAFALFALVSIPLSAQVDRRDVRAGNRKFRRENFKEAEIDFRKALVKDSTSLKASYNLASSLYKQEDYQGAMKSLSSMDGKDNGADWWFNKGDAALKIQDYKTAVDAFRQALLQTPEDMDAKESYTYAKMMLQNQQNQQNKQDQNQNQQNQQDQSKDQQDQQNQNQDQDKQDRNQGQQPEQISSQQAQQMLRAIQAREKETQDKVNKEKAAALQSRQKEKNW